MLVLAGRWGQFASAADGAPWWALTAAAALQIASLLARTEAWNVCVHAAGGTVDRRRVYRAAGVGYLGNIVNGELGFAARIASLRRAAPRETPKAVVLAATEIPIVLMEVALATLFSFTLVAPLSLPWWTPLVAFCAVLAIVVGSRPAGPAPPERMVEGSRRARRCARPHTRRNLRGARRLRAGRAQLADAVRQRRPRLRVRRDRGADRRRGARCATGRPRRRRGGDGPDPRVHRCSRRHQPPACC